MGVPQVHHFGQEGLHNVLVIDLLGPNLEDLFDMCGRKFTIKTVCMAAKQMVCSLNIILRLHVCVRACVSGGHILTLWCSHPSFDYPLILAHICLDGLILL